MLVQGGGKSGGIGWRGEWVRNINIKKSRKSNYTKTVTALLPTASIVHAYNVRGVGNKRAVANWTLVVGTAVRWQK